MPDPQPPWLVGLVAELEANRDEIESEIGPFTWRRNDPHEEIVIVLQPGPGARRAYMASGRIIIDDYFPLDSERD